LTLPARWKFEATSAATRLREASDELDRILAMRGASGPTRYAARLVAEELVLNAFEHGGATLVAMRADPTVDPLGLHFEDNGVQFDPTKPPPSREPSDESDPSPRGRGLQLVHNLTNRIEHWYAAGTNRVTVVLRS